MRERVYKLFEQMARSSCLLTVNSFIGRFFHPIGREMLKYWELKRESLIQPAASLIYQRTLQFGLRSKVMMYLFYVIPVGRTYINNYRVAALHKKREATTLSSHPAGSRSTSVTTRSHLTQPPELSWILVSRALLLYMIGIENMVLLPKGGLETQIVFKLKVYYQQDVYLPVCLKENQ